MGDAAQQGILSKRLALIVPEPAEDASEYQAFSFGRVGTRARAMICFIKADGFHLALPYLDLRSISTIDPAKGFELEFGNRKITVTGRNLEVAFRYIRDHRLAELTEMLRHDALKLAESDSVVDELRVSQTKE